LATLLLMVLAFLNGVKSQRCFVRVACALLLAFLALEPGCGGSGGGGGPPPNPGTPAGTYSVKITGTSGSLVQSSSVTLVVQ
jgi:hypothetical protein